MRQDPDDISDKYRFEKIMKKIKTGIDICGSNMIERSLFIPNDSYIKKVPEKHKDIMHYLKIRNPFSHPTVCINNKLFQNFKYPDLLLKEDYALWSNILSENNVLLQHKNHLLRLVTRSSRLKEEEVSDIYFRNKTSKNFNE